VATLLEKQQGICNHCGLSFTSEDILEVDHIIPKVLGGKDLYNNLQLLHKHCHHIKTATDGSNWKRPLKKKSLKTYSKDNPKKVPDKGYEISKN
jgi:5-methylcytosine-specific restriction endonuclease McrA